MRDIRQKLLATFQIECRDHLEQIRSLMGSGAKSGPPVEAELEEAFRRAHSLKGAARVVDLPRVESLAHCLETLFSRVRQRTLILDAPNIALVQQTLDVIEDCAMPSGEDPSARFTASLFAIEKLVGMKSEAPSEPGPPQPAPIPGFQQPETVRIAAHNFDGLLRSAAGLLTEIQSQSELDVRLTEVGRQIAAIEKEVERLFRTSSGARSSTGARRDSAAMSFSFDRLTAQTRSLARQVAAVRRGRQRSSWRMSQLGKQIQRDVWQARMVPASGLLEGFRKMMRDLARDQSKEIEFRATSTEVHVDRRVLDGVKDPLMHALRNAVSHGIESPPERIAKGKPPAGLVVLRVDTEGTRLQIVVEDDGRGLDPERIAQAAVRDNLLSEAEAARCTHQELEKILFRPGFSTAGAVTKLSGRGMGLSVAAEGVRRLQGEVNFKERKTGGTALQFSIPLSLSSHRLLLARSGGQTFALPVHCVERLHRVKRTSVESLEGRPTITLDGSPVSLVAMQDLLGLSNSPEEGEPDMLRVVVLRTQAGHTAVVVDVLVGEIDAIIQDLGPTAPPDGKISGGIVLDDGSIAFVVDPVDLLRNSSRSEAPSFLKSVEAGRQTVQPSILVVDDSITTRTLEKSILEAHGYRVRVAVDGMEALTQLSLEKVDLVISDVQMPRMNGFELLDAIKANPNLRDIPVIIVTSVADREEQERGLALGADAYLLKQKFDQENLLVTIRQIL